MDASKVNLHVEQAATPRFLCRGLLAAQNPERAHGIKDMPWLPLEEIVPEPLTGNVAGLFKCCEGDYRVIYEPLRKERLIVVHEIGHRRDIVQENQILKGGLAHFQCWFIGGRKNEHVQIPRCARNDDVRFAIQQQ